MTQLTASPVRAQSGPALGAMTTSSTFSLAPSRARSYYSTSGIRGSMWHPSCQKLRTPNPLSPSNTCQGLFLILQGRYLYLKACIDKNVRKMVLLLLYHHRAKTILKHLKGASGAMQMAHYKLTIIIIIIMNLSNLLQIHRPHFRILLRSGRVDSSWGSWIVPYSSNTTATTTTLSRTFSATTVCIFTM